MSYEYYIMIVLFQLFINLLIVNLFIVIKNKIKKSTLVNINMLDTNKYLYYREILKKLSIAEIGYLFSGKKNPKKLIMSTVENLELKHNIKWDNNNINVIDNNTTFENEKYLLEKYKFVGTKEFENNFIKLTEESLINKGYIKKLINVISPSFYIFLIITLLMMIGSAFMLSMFNLPYFIITAATLLVLIILSLTIKNDLSTKYYRTNEGSDIYLKIVALKRFIHDFSNFEEKQLEEIRLWDEYILYAIILNESKNIESNITNKYLSLFN